MKRILLATLCLAGIGGCNDTKQPANTSTTSTTATDPAVATTHDRDNSAVNQRDRDANAKTPFDQKEDKADIDITAGIRKRIVSSEMSTDAKNVKIVTENGHVTLRGPVKSAAEKAQIETIAEQVAGTGKIDNQLEIANQH